MFEWFEKEISAIKTHRFHVFEEIDEQARKAIELESPHIPISYKTFVLKFGSCKLYRASRLGYRIGIFAEPRILHLEGATPIYQIGFREGAKVCIQASSDIDQDFRVFEMELDSRVDVADDFSEWLIVSSARAKKAYSKKKWTEILKGPAPFSEEEFEIVEARRQIQWQILGVDSFGLHRFKVTNHSQRKLPVLTLGVRSRNGKLNGAIALNIRTLEPHETKTILADCYKDFVPPNEVEIFNLPDPMPEDRCYYKEFSDTHR